MAKAYVRDNVPLSRFGVLVAQLESIVFTSAHKSPDPLLCFDLLSDLISAINEEPKESINLWQRKCEDALYSLIVLGARRPVRHLASVAMSMIILKGDSISIYSRASTLQGFLSDGRKNEPLRVAGAAQCLGNLYRHFGRKITSGLLETTAIVTKLMRYNEDFVRQEALQMLWNALEGSGGNAAFPAYAEAFRLIMRLAIGDKSFIVRIAAARCLTAFANIGGPGLGVVDIDNSSSYCMKALEDPVSSVRDAFAEALGALLALGMNPESQVQPKGKGSVAPKKLEGGLQKHLILPFTKASGPRSKNLRIGLTLSWVFFLQAIRVKYLHPDSELQNFVVPVMDMLRADASVDAQAVACVLYILRVGVTDQMSEPTQRGFLVLLGKQLQAPDSSPSIQIAALRTLSYALKTLGEVPPEFKEVLDDTVVAALSHPSPLVRVEAALTWRALAEVDPTCVGGLISFGVTTLSALRENVAFEKGSNLQYELDSLHGQATVLAALMSISPKLPLGYPARLPRSVLDVSKKMLTESSRNPVVATVEKEAGWLLLSSLLDSMPKEEMEYQVFDILSLWTPVFSRDPENQINKEDDLSSAISVWAASIDALTAFIKSFLSPDDVNQKILLQPVLLYLSLALSYVSVLSAKEQPNVKQALDLFTIRILIAYSSLSDPMAYKSDHQQVIQICTTPFRDASACEEGSCLRMLLDKRDAWLGPWIPGRDWFEDELRAFEGGKNGVLPCVWENETPIFPQPETISKMLVNQMILGFGTMFACQDSGGMLSLLGTIDQCLKTGRRQAWHAASVTNICAALLAGLKALLSLRSQPLGMEILNAAQAIFQSILAEGEISESQRRASSEGLGMLTRLGNDMFTARLTRLLLGDVTGGMDSNYAGSVALAIGCIHRSAGGMALSSLVPSTVNFLSTLARSSAAGLQIWSLHGLLLTIESAGLSYVSHVQPADHTEGETQDIHVHHHKVRPKLSCDSRMQVVMWLLNNQTEGKLKHGAIQEVARLFNVTTRTISTIWSTARRQQEASQLYNMATKGHNSGRKRIEVQPNAITEISMGDRACIRDLAVQLKVSSSTASRMIKRGDIKPHTNPLHPALKEANLFQRVDWVLKLLMGDTPTTKRQYYPMYNFVHIDEKWFYLSKKSQRCYLARNEKGKYRVAKSSKFIPKVMFTAAVGRPRFNAENVCTFDGKIGIFPFTYQEAAKRASKYRAKGTVVTKIVESVGKKETRSMLINEIIPAIMQKWPISEGPKTIYIQQDNARTHIGQDDLEWQQVHQQGDFTFILVQQPPNSPDLNILDLGFFRSIQSLMHKKMPKDVDDMLNAVHQAYCELDATTLGNVWLSYQYVMNEVLKVKGSNDYLVPHVNKKKLAAEGKLPVQVTAPMWAVHEAWNYIHGSA